MIPICKERGCHIAKSGRPRCTRGCVLAQPERADAAVVKKKPAPLKLSPPQKPETRQAPEPETLKPEMTREPKSPKRESPRTHLGTGVIVTPKTLPPWRHKPTAPEPWEKAQCGAISNGPMPTDTTLVNCESCLRAAKG